MLPGWLGADLEAAAGPILDAADDPVKSGWVLNLFIVGQEATWLALRQESIALVGLGPTCQVQPFLLSIPVRDISGSSAR